MKITLSEDIDRIRSLMTTDSLDIAIAQYSDTPFDIQELGTSYYLIISDNDIDIGIFILDRLSYNDHYNIHTGFIKSARGPKAFIGGMLFLDYIKGILPHACLIGMIPGTKLPCVKYGISIGFKLSAIVPNAIELGNKTNNTGSERADMYILTYNW